MQQTINPRILYIDDYSDSCQLIDMLLYIKRCRYSFSTANTPAKALELIFSQSFDLYILENKLPEMSGIELCSQIRQVDKQAPILFYAQTSSAFARDSFIKAGATEYLAKPADLEQISDTIKVLLGEKAPVQTEKAAYAAAHKTEESSQIFL